MVSDPVLRSMQARALRAGATRLSLMSVEWDISGSCEEPTTREIVSVADATYAKQSWSRKNGFRRLILHARCRKCASCLRLRAYEWRNRIATEINQSSRTWFMTFTLTPEEHHLCALRAMQRLRKGGWKPEDLSVIRDFQERSREFGYHLTRYFKRLRKNTGSDIRYVLVSERHKSGLPHYHALIHERPGSKVTYRQLCEEWPHGFVTAKLVDNSEGSSRYITKYVAKSALSRIRASLRYGKSS